MTQAASSLITAEQQAQYEQRGYCVVDGLFTGAAIAEIEQFFERYKHEGGNVFSGGLKYEEVDFTKRQLRAMHPHRYSTRARDWMLHPPVASVLEILFGKAPLAAQTMYYFKPPGAKGQGMHQDNFYLAAKPATCIAAWTAIDDADIANGCLYVAEGSHRKDIYCPEGTESWMEYGDSTVRPFPREFTPIPLPVRSGQTLFFSGNLIHGSGPNRTKDRSRRTFIGHYIDEASEQVAQSYHPVLRMSGEVVSGVREASGGPCGDGFFGAVH